MSNFVSLYTGLTAIRAAQTGLDTASHNVANVNTAGYTRQRVDLASRAPFYSFAGPVGTGVDVAGIARTRDAFLDARFRTVTAESTWHGTTTELLTRTEAVLAEPDNGVSDQLGALWDAFEDLGSDPADGAARQQVVSTLGLLAARVRAVAVGWDQLAEDTTRRLQGAVEEANDLLVQVADLNRRIGDMGLRDGHPNDLDDQRDLALDRLAGLLGAVVSPQEDGSVRVTLPRTDGPGEVALVDGVVAQALALEGKAITVDDGGGPVEVAGRGETFALQEWLVSALPGRQARLEVFVADLADALNGRHADGFDGYGDAGGDLLTLDPDAAAPTLRVAESVATDPRRLAAASQRPVAAHDGRNAERLAALRTDKLDGAATLDDRVTQQVVDLAAAVANSRRAADAQSSLAVAATTARQSVHGVSIDEEMVSVVSHQRALEAASRVMTAVDQALDTLVNRTGVVGR